MTHGGKTPYLAWLPHHPVAKHGKDFGGRILNRNMAGVLRAAAFYFALSLCSGPT